MPCCLQTNSLNDAQKKVEGFLFGAPADLPAGIAPLLTSSRHGACMVGRCVTAAPWPALPPGGEVLTRPAHADMRKNLFEYDQVLNTQRDKVYSIRRQALLEPNLSEQLLDFSARTMDDILEVHALQACLAPAGTVQLRACVPECPAGCAHSRCCSCA